MSFNSRLRDECLNEHAFLSLAEARLLIDAWRDDYNHVRPHSSLGALTPIEFVTSKGADHSSKFWAPQSAPLLHRPTWGKYIKRLYFSPDGHREQTTRNLSLRKDESEID
jgi:integrase-like protein